MGSQNHSAGFAHPVRFVSGVSGSDVQKRAAGGGRAMCKRLHGTLSRASACVHERPPLRFPALSFSHTRPASPRFEMTLEAEQAALMILFPVHVKDMDENSKWSVGSTVGVTCRSELLEEGEQCADGNKVISNWLRSHGSLLRSLRCSPHLPAAFCHRRRGEQTNCITCRCAGRQEQGHCQV